MSSANGVTSVRELCLTILEGGDLGAKLTPIKTSAGADLDDDDRGAAMVLDEPRRDASLRLSNRAERLPPLTRLRHDERARLACLERFAHHELMAVELFAWSLVTWPTMPGRLRRGIVAVIADEQRHLRLYLARLAQLGTTLGASGPLSDYLWRHARAIRESPSGPLAFLAAMGLTFEQANLDFTAFYADEMRKAGDVASAEILDRIHHDEEAHVRLAVDWLRRLKDPALRDHEAYARAVPFPLGPARAKGRRFDVAARKRSGMDDDFVAFVANARPYDDRRRP